LKAFKIILAILVAVSVLPAVAQSLIGSGGPSGGDYEISPEDVLEISVWKEESLQREVLVRPDGWLTFPLAGNVRASGRTALELQGEITNRLRKYIPDPVVTVSVKKIVGNKIYVIGQVKKPGPIIAGRYLDVLQALSLAGGLTPYASENNIKIIRKRKGEERVFLFRYGDVKNGKSMKQNIMLKSGDVVVVP